MRRKLGWIALAACAVALIAATVSVAYHVQADKENVVASRLEGAWVVERTMTARLTGAERDGAVKFVSDPTVASGVPDKYDKFLKSKQIYMAGWFKAGDKDKFPFILIEHKGNPHLVYFRPRDGDPLGDAESFNVMLAVAKNKVDDLLFIGGDFNNQPFTAYQRKAGSTQPD